MVDQERLWLGVPIASLSSSSRASWFEEQLEVLEKYIDNDSTWLDFVRRNEPTTSNLTFFDVRKLRLLLDLEGLERYVTPGGLAAQAIIDTKIRQKLYQVWKDKSLEITEQAQVSRKSKPVDNAQEGGEERDFVICSPAMSFNVYYPTISSEASTSTQPVASAYKPASQTLTRSNGKRLLTTPTAQQLIYNVPSASSAENNKRSDRHMRQGQTFDTFPASTSMTSDTTTESLDEEALHHQRVESLVQSFQAFTISRTKLLNQPVPIRAAKPSQDPRSSSPSSTLGVPSSSISSSVKQGSSSPPLPLGIPSSSTSSSLKRSQSSKPRSAANKLWHPTIFTTLSDEAPLARKRFIEDFPHGYRLIETPGTNLLCGLRALIASLPAQGINASVSMQQLRGYMQAPNITNFENETLDEARRNSNNYYIDQLATILLLWGQQHGLDLQLGFLLSDNRTFLVPIPINTSSNTRVVWIYSTISTVGDDDELQHYEGIAPRSQIMSKERKSSGNKGKERATQSSSEDEDNAKSRNKGKERASQSSSEDEVSRPLQSSSDSNADLDSDSYSDSDFEP